MKTPYLSLLWKLDKKEKIKKKLNFIKELFINRGKNKFYILKKLSLDLNLRMVSPLGN